MTEFRGWIVVLSLLVSVFPLAAQAPTEETASDETLRAAVQRHFQNRLRAELALTDEQFEAVWPRIERLEQERRMLRRERAEALRELRRAYHGGSPDAELQAALDRLTEAETGASVRERELLAEIDDALTVRQRVEFRFVVSRFRQQLQRRIQEIRRERAGPDEPGSRRRWQPRRPRDPRRP